MHPQEGALLRVSGQLKSIVKHRILGLGKRVSCAKKTDGPILTICTSMFFLRKELRFGGHCDCTCMKIFSGINFLQ